MAAKRTGLARARKAAGLTQESLAEAMHIDRSTIVRWESGQTEPQPYLRPKLARMLGVSLAKLEDLLAPGQPAGAPDSSQESSTGTNVLLPALGVEEAAHATKALREASRYFDGPVVDYFRRQLDACMVDDGEIGPAKALPTVLGLLHAVERCAREVRPSLRRELLSAPALPSSPAGCTGTPTIPSRPPLGTTEPWNGPKKPLTSQCRATSCSRNPKWPTTPMTRRGYSRSPGPPRKAHGSCRQKCVPK